MKRNSDVLITQCNQKMAWSWYGVAVDIILACDPVIINLLNGLVVEKAEERLFVEKREPRIKNHFMDVERPVRDTIKPHFPSSLLGVSVLSKTYKMGLNLF